MARIAGWRWWAAPLAAVPAAVAAADGVPAAGAWIAAPVVATVFTAPRPRGAVVLAGLAAAAVVGARLWSGGPAASGVALRPPASDWYVPSFVVAGLLLVVAIGLRWQDRRPLADEDGPGRVLVLGASGLLVLCCAGAFGGVLSEVGPFGHRVGDVRPEEYRPLPEGLTLRLVDRDCSGTSGACTETYLAEAPGPATDPLIAHLRARGWAVGVDAAACRPMRGVFAWRSRCVSIRPTSGDPERAHLFVF